MPYLSLFAPLSLFALSHLSWLNLFVKTVSLNFSCIAACISCITSSLLTLAYLPGSHRGVGQKRGSETPEKLSYFARPCAQTVPSARGSSFLGFTPRCRPAAGGPAPSLIKCRFPPGSPCGVRRKRAIALSQFCLTLFFLLLFLLVFAQAPAAKHTHTRTEPMKNVCFCPMNSGNYGLVSCLCCTHPFEGENPKFTSAQVCARSLSRREWKLSCQLSPMGPAGPSLPVFCYCFTDISLVSIHSPLPDVVRSGYHGSCESIFGIELGQLYWSCASSSKFWPES